jgi:transposase
LAALNGADKIDWSRARVDSATTKAPSSGNKTGPNPTDRRKLGSNVHDLVDAKGIPLAFKITEPTPTMSPKSSRRWTACQRFGGKKGRPRQRPDIVQGDRGYDSEPHRDLLRQRRIQPQLAKRRTEHGSGLGKTRWYVERTLAWFKRYGKIRIRTERRAENYEALLTLAACLICHQNL